MRSQTTTQNIDATNFKALGAFLTTKTQILKPNTTKQPKIQPQANAEHETNLIDNNDQELS